MSVVRSNVLGRNVRGVGQSVRYVRNVRGAKCPGGKAPEGGRTKYPLSGISVKRTVRVGRSPGGKVSVGRNVSGARFHGARFMGRDFTGRVVMGRISMGRMYTRQNVRIL